MGIDFYQMSQDFLGSNLPNTLNWLYDFMTVIFVLMAILVLLSPIIVIFRIIRGGR